MLGLVFAGVAMCLCPVVDEKSARDAGYIVISNSVTNKSEAGRILRKCAK